MKRHKKDCNGAHYWNLLPPDGGPEVAGVCRGCHEVKMFPTGYHGNEGFRNNMTLNSNPEAT